MYHTSTYKSKKYKISSRKHKRKSLQSQVTQGFLRYKRIKGKNGYIEFHQVNKFCSLKGIVKRMKTQNVDFQKITANHIYDTGFFPYCVTTFQRLK